MAIEVRNLKGVWKLKSYNKKTDSLYEERLINYLNVFSNLFDIAKNTHEFEFICTLIRGFHILEPGWDPWETTQEIFGCMARLAQKTRDFKTNLHLHLWLYGHIIEASEPYEILANLIRICSGERFCGNNFPDIKKGKRIIPQTAAEKINKLEQMAVDINMVDWILPLKDVFDRNLRNAIFHADYSLYADKVRLVKQKSEYSLDKIRGIMLKGGAYYQAIVTIFNYHIGTYNKPKIVPVHKNFGTHPNENAAIIIRKGYGLIGFKDNWTTEELRKGYMSYMWGRFHKYELERLNKDLSLTVLPSDKIKKANNLLKLCPKFLRKYVIKRLKHKL